MLLVLAPIGIALVLLVSLVVANGNDDVAGPSQPVPRHSATPAAPSPTLSTAAPSRRPSATRPTTSRATRSTSTAPTPSREPSTTRPERAGPYRDVPVLSDSALYDIELGPWTCSRLSNPIAPEGKAFGAWIDAVIDCMMDRFGPAVSEATGRELPRPKVVYFSGTIETPCGRKTDRVPFYCSSSQSMAIYLNPSVIRTYDDGIRLGAVQIIFHEFAHHVQSRFRLLSAGYQADVEDRMQVSRRVELQAECISWSQTTLLTKPRFGPRDADQFWRWVSMDQDAGHGRATSYRYWFTRIKGKGDLGLCNTWVAAKKHVR